MKLTAIAREDLEAKGLILKNKIELKCRGTAIPDIYAERIGRKNVDTGEFESFFKVDNKNGNTVRLGSLTSKIASQAMAPKVTAERPSRLSFSISLKLC